VNISIWYRNDEYHWEFYDGPDGIDHYTGIGNSLGDVFEQIIEKQLLNRMRY
jgi:hypothetical protein